MKKFDTIVENILNEKFTEINQLYKVLKKMGWKKADDSDMIYNGKDGVATEITYDYEGDAIEITQTATKGSGGATKDYFDSQDFLEMEEALQWIKDNVK